MSATANDGPLPEIDPTKELAHAKDVYVTCRSYRRSTICKSAAEFARDAALDAGGPPRTK